MKLIQLNIWGGRLGDQLNDLLSSEKPDVLCLQEAIDLDRGRGALFTSIGEISEAIGLKYHYMSPAFSFNFMHRKAHFGNCIISRLPFVSQETVFTGREYEVDFDWTEHTQNIRNLQHVQLRLPDGELLHVFNHHGHHNYADKNGDDETIRQCSLIADKIKAISGKRILAGDFNLVPHSKSLQPINTLLRNLTAEANLRTTRTELTKLTEPCDYIFVSDDVKVKSFTASDALVSDHQALIMEFN
ncbi:MAG TPA: endonuclease/exonuclease/phosphatase family protein [Candidatus Dormibacteraeota bacterium]|nr:endonuclease/exonuclease/phosphatase family protein [Candidatus Dormibacteraeota bacterium]